MIGLWRCELAMDDEGPRRLQEADLLAGGQAGLLGERRVAFASLVPG